MPARARLLYERSRRVLEGSARMLSANADLFCIRSPLASAKEHGNSLPVIFHLSMGRLTRVEACSSPRRVAYV